MEHQADPLRTRVACWLARTALRIEVQESVPAEQRREDEFPPPIDDRRMISELVGVIALARLHAREETLAEQTRKLAQLAPARRITVADPGFPDDLFPDHYRGVSIPDDFLTGLLLGI